jgi:CDP-4-dehydro-6-deoxyglucose reductase, E3
MSGTTKQLKPQFISIPDSFDPRSTLLCCHSALTDLHLDVEDLSGLNLQKAQIVPSKISSIKLLESTVMEVKLRFPPSVSLRFRPGQYINLKNRFGVSRSYSIVQLDQSVMTLHVKNYAGGAMSNYIFSGAKIDDLLQVEGPLGTFGLRSTEKSKLVFVATGTGIAPIISMLSDTDTNFFENKVVYIYWGGRTIENIYLDIRALGFDAVFIPVLSREVRQGFRQGYVQNSVVHDIPDLSDAVVYACGSAEMIDDSRKLFSDRGLHEDCFYADSFVATNSEEAL